MVDVMVPILADSRRVRNANLEALKLLEELKIDYIADRDVSSLTLAQRENV